MKQLEETNEEISLNKDEMKLQFKLTDIYIPPSTLVRPYVFKIENEPEIKPNSDEVVKVITPKLSSLIKLKINYGKTNNQNLKSYFLIENHVVLGATAMILNEFCHYLSNDLCLYICP